MNPEVIHTDTQENSSPGDGNEHENRDSSKHDEAHRHPHNMIHPNWHPHNMIQPDRKQRLVGESEKSTSFCAYSNTETMPTLRPQAEAKTPSCGVGSSSDDTFVDLLGMPDLRSKVDLDRSPEETIGKMLEETLVLSGVEENCPEFRSLTNTDNIKTKLEEFRKSCQTIVTKAALMDRQIEKILDSIEQFRDQRPAPSLSSIWVRAAQRWMKTLKSLGSRFMTDIFSIRN